MGKSGIHEAALLNARKAHYAASAAAALPGYSVPLSAPFFNEFVLRLPGKRSCAALSERLLSDDILSGYDLGQSYPELTGHMLLAVTEKRTRADIDRLLSRLEEYA
jgi:glycine dehydrogenase subunit 1